MEMHVSVEISDDETSQFYNFNYDDKNVDILTDDRFELKISDKVKKFVDESVSIVSKNLQRQIEIAEVEEDDSGHV